MPVQPKALSESLSVAGQPSLEDFPAIAEAGFKTVICNRPDGEAAGQPDHEAAQKAAEAAGLAYHYLPVTAPTLGEADIAAFARLLEASPKPILAHCASGGRSSLLWALADNSVSAEDALARTAEAGYDLSGQAGRIAAARK